LAAPAVVAFTTVVTDAASTTVVFTVMVTDAMSTTSSRRNSPCLARGKKKQGKEVTQVAWFLPATPPMVTGIDSVVSRRWWDV